MVEFSKLRLVGFKSFVEPTEFLIDSGLTGVVGPNGCGKSNVVEALRWVMGENSAKRLRGADMDDVIFSGTTSRPSRNFAEVQLTLKAPESGLAARFPDSEELHITRRIDRGSGSTFRVNGKEVRASDVRLLFADLSSGAQSASIVAQGKVASLIDAKPTDRRMLLEEAAGTTGLAGRRKEAETRLKASESNLTRVGDLTQALAEQLKTLNTQAVEAEKFRKLSDDIRVLEALLALVTYNQSSNSVERGRVSKSKLVAKLVEVEAEVTAMAASVTDANAALPALREQDAAAGAKLQRLIVELDNIGKEAARIATAKEENARAQEQLSQDMLRESTLAKDATAALEKLTAEAEQLEAQKEGQDQTLATLESETETARTQVETIEELVAQKTEELAKLKAEQNSLASAQCRANEQVDRLSARCQSLEAQLAQLLADSGNKADLGALEAQFEAAQKAVADAGSRIQGLLSTLGDAKQGEDRTQAAFAEARERQNSFRNELQALQRIAATGKEKSAASNLLSDGTLSAQPGYEQALAAALGPAASASLADQASAEHSSAWTPLGEQADGAGAAGWPAGVQSLAQLAQGPARFARFFNQVGVAASPQEAASAQSQLQRGQVLTSVEGGVWRWDGFASLPGAEEKALAERLRQVARIEELAGQLEAAEAVTAQAKSQADEARAARTKLDEQLREARRQENDARTQERKSETAKMQAEREQFSVNAKQENLTQRLDEAREELDAAKAALDELPVRDVAQADLEALEQALADERSTLGKAREALSEATGKREQARREAVTREARLGQIFSEKHDWEGRSQNARHFQRSLEERKEALCEAAVKLASMPAQFEAQQQALRTSIQEAESERKLKSDALAAAEAQDRERQVSLRAVEGEANRMKTELAALEASLASDEERLAEIIEEIREKFRCGPGGLYELAQVSREDPLPNKGDVDRKLKGRMRDRDNLGDVNLMAQSERDTLKEHLDTLAIETVELEKAIAKLRASIAEINKEGRERLSAAFDTVNEAFKGAFTKLFGGGKAELKLIEDKDDPLNSGLEIFAQPPGKKVSSLSLMSGGERSLAAIALIFALFRSNPAPVCVLDEVDAPLDDHNVGRFVDLVQEMADELGTRFIVITHHAITMAKMDRLYGVTMGEPGVSQAFGVDLQQAELALAS